jgi:MATE family multidrug resistance protein
MDPAVIPLTVSYVHMIAWGAPAICAYLSLRFMSEGVGQTWPIMVVALAGLVANVFGNWVFMFGNLGAPAMGAVGAALASAITMGIMLVVMAGFAGLHRGFRAYRLFVRFDPPRPRALLALLALGVPISASVVAEAGLFSVTALMMGTLGAATVAGHQVAMNYASTMFMVPLALSSATTIRVGQALGAGQASVARFRAVTGIIACTSFMAVSALVMILFREQVVRLYTTDAAVAQVAISLLAMAALFQVADGLQVGAAGALRGYKDTRVPMAMCLVAYWLIGFPLAWTLGLRLSLGAQFIWVGVLAGLCAAAILLVWRLSRVARRPVHATEPLPPQVPPAA